VSIALLSYVSNLPALTWSTYLVNIRTKDIYRYVRSITQRHKSIQSSSDVKASSHAGHQREEMCTSCGDRTRIDELRCELWAEYATQRQIVESGNHRSVKNLDLV